MRRTRQRIDGAGRSGIALGLALFLSLGCVGIGLTRAPSFDYFGPAEANDAWSPKIVGWQLRERADQGDVFGTLPSVAESSPETRADALTAALDTEPTSAAEARLGADDAAAALPAEAGTDAPADLEPTDLRSKYFYFRASRKRALARQFAEWIQGQAKQHYVADGPIDHWATLEETLRSDGDDCDGLELLTFHGLRDLGFEDSEVFRSIVYRPSDGQHHMVTLWFEDVSDPWVIDPTGAMATGMPRMSELTAWVPLKVFSETVEYTVRRRPSPTALAANP